MIAKETISRVFFEGIIIIFSVLFALIVNDWRQSRDEAALAERVIASIRDEIQHNKLAVESSLAHHRTTIMRLRGDSLALAMSFDIPGATLDSGKIPELEALVRKQAMTLGMPPDVEIKLIREGANRFQVVAGDVSGFGLVENGKLNVYVRETGIQLKPASLRNNTWPLLVATNAAVKIDYSIVAGLSGIYQIQQKHDDLVSTILRKIYGFSNNRDFLNPLYDLTHYEDVLLREYEALLTLIDAPQPDKKE